MRARIMGFMVTEREIESLLADLKPQVRRFLEPRLRSWMQQEEKRQTRHDARHGPRCGAHARSIGLPCLAAAPLSLLNRIDELLRSNVRQVPTGRREAGMA